jgi:hypothetical protein
LLVVASERHQQDYLGQPLHIKVLRMSRTIQGVELGVHEDLLKRDSLDRVSVDRRQQQEEVCMTSQIGRDSVQ